jgi:hypothetical protein
MFDHLKEHMRLQLTLKVAMVYPIDRRHGCGVVRLVDFGFVVARDAGWRFGESAEVDRGGSKAWEDSPLNRGAEVGRTAMQKQQLGPAVSTVL